MKTARNPETGERLILGDDGVWHLEVKPPPVAPEATPDYGSHPLAVPGLAWQEHRRRQRLADFESYRKDELGKLSPDPRYVDPPRFKD